MGLAGRLLNLTINSRNLFFSEANVTKALFISQSDKLVSECLLVSVVEVGSKVNSIAVATLIGVKFNLTNNCVVSERVL